MNFDVEFLYMALKRPGGYKEYPWNSLGEQCNKCFQIKKYILFINQKPEKHRQNVNNIHAFVLLIKYIEVRSSSSVKPFVI